MALIATDLPEGLRRDALPATLSRWQDYLNRQLVYAGEDPYPISIVSEERITDCLNRRRFDGLVHGHQDLVVLSGDAVVLITDFDRMPAVQFKQDSDGLLFIQFRLEGDWTLAAGERCRSFDRPATLISYFSPGIPRDIQIAAGAWRGVALIVRESALERWRLMSSMPEALRDLLRSGEAGAYLASQLMSHDILEQVRAIMACDYPGDLRRAYVEAKAIETLCNVLSRLHDLTDEDAANARFSPADARRVKAAHALLETEMVANHTLASVARRVGLNRSKLAAAFKALYGVTFFDRLRDLRMAEACRLLDEGDTSICMVAQRVGYEDPCSFTRAFKRRFGVAPRLAKSRRVA